MGSASFAQSLICWHTKQVELILLPCGPDVWGILATKYSICYLVFILLRMISINKHVISVRQLSIQNMFLIPITIIIKLLNLLIDTL